MHLPLHIDVTSRADGHERTSASIDLVRARRSGVASARRGAVLVEFALIALAFYLLMAGTIEIGRMVFASQILQNAARVGARELAMVPLPATHTFAMALEEDSVRINIYDSDLLAKPIDGMSDLEVENMIAGWPVVNRMLAPLMINETVKTDLGTYQMLRYPGALLQNTSGSGAPFAIAIPRVTSSPAGGGETVVYVPVVEEILPDGNPTLAPFSLEAAPLKRERGLVALRINYPFQAATLSSYKTDGTGINTPVIADDGAVDVDSGPVGGELMGNVESLSGHATYDGPHGLGKQYALLEQVRPFRRLLSAQSIFRREVYSATPTPP